MDILYNLNSNIALIIIFTVLLLAVLLYFKMREADRLKAMTNKLQRSLNEMDEQAKLIVRTDMELNKTQEELDQKISGLYMLQRLSHTISTTLEESQIFKMIEASSLNELGFEKACGFLWNEAQKSFLLQMNIGYAEEELRAIKDSLDSYKLNYLGLMKNEKATSSVSLVTDAGFRDKIKQAFNVAAFIISPILPKEGDRGLLFVGTQNANIILNEGDEELIIILANQLGQALENARLFEKTWRSQQDLERKVIERTLDLTRAMDELKIINDRKTEFVSSVSHELRTPLTSIKGYASILLTGKLGEIPPEVRERLDKINRHSDELVHLVNDLLDIARIESGRMIMKKESLGLNTIIEGVADLLSAQLKDKFISLQASVPSEANLIYADHNQIERVFINLVGNAIKFTPQGGKISIKAHDVSGSIQIDVTDSGCGIPQEAQEKIFEEFYRVDNLINQQAKGTGLGLTLVKRIVEAHDGKVWVKSSPDAGATFSFTMPRPS